MFKMLIMVCSPLTYECQAISPDYTFLSEVSCEYAKDKALMVVEGHGYVVTNMICYYVGEPA